MLEVRLAEPRGFCAGVSMAIKAVEQAIIDHPSRAIYVLHEIVHNQYILEEFIKEGVNFTEDISEIPAGAVLILSAHGVSQEVEDRAMAMDITLINATCPLVTKVHNQARSYEKLGHQIVLIGHSGHVEVVGTAGRLKDVQIVGSIAELENLSVKDPEKLAYITQTTLSLEDTQGITQDLHRRFPKVKGPGVDNICYATQNRQSAIKELLNWAELVLVVGSTTSSNAMRLVEIARNSGVNSYIINRYFEVEAKWLEKVERLAITSGASTPEILVQELIDYLPKLLGREIKIGPVQPFAEEKLKFKLPIPSKIAGSSYT